MSSKEWQCKKWGDITTLEYGKALRDYKDRTSGVPVFGTNGQIGYTDKALYNSSGVIVGRKGAYRGIHYSNEPFSVIDTAFYLKPIMQDAFDMKWAYYELLTKDINSMDSGSAIPSTSRNDFYALPVSLPAIEEQRTIAATLSALDDKIELNNRINKTLEEMAQALFKRWFVDFEFPDENGQPYKSSGGEMEESELGLIPKGWKVKQLGDVITLSTKTVNPQNHNTKLFEHFSIPCFDDKKTPMLEVGENIKSNKFVINSGNILVSKLNPSTKRIWKPLCSTSNAVCSTEFMVYIARNDEHTDFYYSLMDSVEFQNYLLAHVTGSTNSRQRVTPSSTLFFKYVEPADPILKKFVEIAKPVFSKTQINTIENCRLMKTRDSLLPKIMSGEIWVPIEEVSAHV